MREMFYAVGTLGLIGAISFFITLLVSTPAGGMEISPAACYAFAGENISANGAHAMLLLNTCTGNLEWVWTPAPPRSEV